MATVLSTLYPPLVDTFMPAFIYNESAYITFSISPYNEKKQIKYLHISLVNQQTNINCFAASLGALSIEEKTNEGRYRNTYTLRDGIWILPINDSDLVSYDEDLELYTVTIPNDLLRDGSKKFSTDIFYKAQIRFDQDSSNKPDPRGSQDYLIAEREHFSEWSSVCLLKAIPQPTLNITQFTDSDSEPTFNPGTIPVIGRLTFDTNLTGKNAETMRSYSIQIFEEGNPANILDSTGTVFTGDSADPNSIYWMADGENAIPETAYVVSITYTTKNQYTETKNFPFNVAAFTSWEDFAPVFTFKKVKLLPYEIASSTSIPSEDLENVKLFTAEDGIIEFNISVTNPLPHGWLYVRRSRMEEGQFKHWELLSCTEESGTINRDFSDMTVASLECYGYSAQYLIKQNNLFTQSYTTTGSDKNAQMVYPDFYDMLFSRDGVQLAVRYDAKITNLTPVVNRQKINTLGGKYPKFAENAQMNYKQFSISGYIDAESDFNRRFLDDTSEKYQKSMENYNTEQNGKYSLRNDTAADETITYKGSSDDYLRGFAQTTLHDLYPHNNWWWQREFRERALEWLNDGEPKLFRSMPEGNMVVMLTDISLSPNQTASRRVYTFNATMHEIEDGYSLDTLATLGIINVPNEKIDEKGSSEGDSDIQITSVSTIGQSCEVTSGAGTSVGVVTSTSGENIVGNGTKDIRFDTLNLLDRIKFINYEGGSTDGQVYQPDDTSLILTDVKIEFENLPRWYSFIPDKENPLKTNIELVTEEIKDENGSVKENIPYALGYKLTLTPLDADSIDIFVDERGFYQVPSNLKIANITLYDGAVASLDYKMQYNLEFNSSLIPSAVDLTNKVIGQISGWWTAQTNLSQLISHKYEEQRYEVDASTGTATLASSTRFLDWSSLSLDVDPYAVFGIQYKNESSFETYVVGRTGIFNLVGDYSFDALRFIGRRMTLASGHVPIDLDEWEFVLDDSASVEDDTRNSVLNWNQFVAQRVIESDTLVDINDRTTTSVEEGINRLWNNDSNEQISALGGYTSISAIETPQFNTVYGVRDESTNELSYVIYYIDHDWYPVTFNDDSTILAQVPISGMINYKGNIITTSY